MTGVSACSMDPTAKCIVTNYRIGAVKRLGNMEAPKWYWGSIHINAQGRRVRSRDGSLFDSLLQQTWKTFLVFMNLCGQYAYRLSIQEKI